jgi:hypothetical protein
LLRELKHEVSREALAVALYLLVEPLDRDTVKRGKIGIEDDAVPAQDQDAGFNGKSEGLGTRGHGELLGRSCNS